MTDSQQTDAHTVQTTTERGVYSLPLMTETVYGLRTNGSKRTETWRDLPEFVQWKLFVANCFPLQNVLLQFALMNTGVPHGSDINPVTFCLVLWLCSHQVCNGGSDERCDVSLEQLSPNTLYATRVRCAVRGNLEGEWTQPTHFTTCESYHSGVVKLLLLEGLLMG